MIGLLLNPTKADFSPEGLLPHEAAMQARAGIRTNPPPASSPQPSRLKRLINSWMAAALAYRERQAAWLAAHQAGDRDASTTNASTEARSTTPSNARCTGASGRLGSS